ncbi:hypothetical protein [Cryobacterium tepidiphilum]|uniref:Uncharacterized protein n=1 Tax=Cryobacterium tepidiphilum TaxID=2486026 RepID=A0A3M8LPP1_9MICO|nr:hypothetical protein [Cryobacterium tepidiphilum]RNE67443.1 hypothetical protein EEJ31_01360 [Cryobacterium tepidiphilum]
MIQPEPDDQAQPPGQIHLVGGVNFSTWPDLKWARGNTHTKALEASFVEWSASAPVSVEGVLRDDRQGIDLVASVPRGIPKHEWALLLGDALHNFRSAFDALAWGMAHFNDAQPSKPKSIYFPICNDQKQWNDAVKSWVGELDPEFQHRLHVLQPFNYLPPGMLSLLRMLHDLDIQDKHKDFLTVSADMNGLSLDGAFFKYEDADVVATPRLEMRTDVKFGDGVVLGTLHAGANIETLGRMILRPVMQVQLTWEGQTFDVGSMLTQFVTETRRHLDILMHGLAPLDDGEGEWLPLDVESLPS